MKNLSRLSVLFLVLLFLGCGDDDENVTTTGSGLLFQLGEALDGVFYRWTDLSYDENQTLTKIEIQVENFLRRVYEVTYAGGEPVSLTQTTENTNGGNVTVTDYDIIQQGDETILRTSEGDQFLYQITDGYIDYCKAYFGPNNEYFTETVFTRNTDNNIEKVEYFVTDAASTDLKVYEYTFADHDNTFDLSGAYNPTLNFSFTGFDAHLGEIMGLKLSNQPPMTSSYWDAGGTFREENIKASPVVDNGVLQELMYEDAGTGQDDYLLRLSYD